MNIRSWADRAKCLKHGPRMWDLDVSHDVETAKRICFSCPVAAECLAEARNEHTVGVIRGGASFGREPGERLQRSRRYAMDHPERVRASRAKCLAAHPDRVRKDRARWERENPGVAMARKRPYEATKRRRKRTVRV